jgi:flagellar biogenesis protein FliO
MNEKPAVDRQLTGKLIAALVLIAFVVGAFVFMKLIPTMPM